MILQNPFHQSVSGDKNLWIRKHQNLVRSLDIRLKTVVLQSYRGIKAQVSFAKFFVMNAKMLGSMIFQVDAGSYSRGFVAQERKKLKLKKRASKGARFHFTTNRYIRCYSVINNVRDLDLADPFVPLKHCSHPSQFLFSPT